MAMKSESDWIDAYAALPQVSDDSWMDELSDYIEEMTADMTLDGFTPAPVFTFDKAAFKSGLAAANSNVLGSGIAALSSAFSAGIAKSVMLATPPVETGEGTPAETFSAVTSTLPDPTSVTAGVNAIGELASAEKTGDSSKSEFPKKLYAAFAGLMYICSGTNSVTPTTSPLVVTAGVI
tara:strand:- start:445 stop:981 length:537 start_codon:yes stop_codon:yes gene_type:complete